MELSQVEVTALEQTTSQALLEAQDSLADLQLAFNGGGLGNVCFY